MADDFIQQTFITEGGFDKIASCRYQAPDYRDMGEVFERLIEVCYKEGKI